MENTTSNLPILNVAAYRFFDFKDHQALREPLKQAAIAKGIRGTFLLTPEGINLFLAGVESDLRAFIKQLHEEFKIPELEYKESFSEKIPFTRMLVKLKKEIISFGVPDVKPAEYTGPEVTPEEFKKWLDEKRDLIILDTRNDYEVVAGTFEGAVDLKIQKFRDFIPKVDELPADWKDKTIVMFCTGGIRCEKASPFMINKGFKNVYQLEGGILKYFEQVGRDHYKGDCFVFDWRLAVDEKLSATPRKDGVQIDKYFNPEVLKDSSKKDQSKEPSHL